MSNIRFVVVSKDKSFGASRERVESHCAVRPGDEFKFIEDNAKPLAEIYNAELDRLGGFDWVALMHADVSLDTVGLAEHVESVAGKYDLIGLCGCDKISVGQTPLNWFCGSRPYPDHRWGYVRHGELGGAESFFNAHHPGVTDHQVSCVDGLCIFLSAKAVKAGLRFDTGLGAFDFYDTDISLQAVMKYGLKAGVVVRKDLVHSSVGKSILGKEFLENERKFREKWGFPLPQGANPAGVKSSHG